MRVSSISQDLSNSGELESSDSLHGSKGSRAPGRTSRNPPLSEKQEGEEERQLRFTKRS